MAKGAGRRVGDGKAHYKKVAGMVQRREVGKARATVELGGMEKAKVRSVEVVGRAVGKARAVGRYRVMERAKVTAGEVARG